MLENNDSHREKNSASRPLFSVARIKIKTKPRPRRAKDTLCKFSTNKECGSS